MYKRQVDVFRGWVSSIGKAVTAKEVITRTVKVTNVGRPVSYTHLDVYKRQAQGRPGISDAH